MLACTHGLHDMCGVQPMAIMVQGMVQPSLPALPQGHSVLCIELVHEAMGTMPWHDGATKAPRKGGVKGWSR